MSQPTGRRPSNHPTQRAHQPITTRTWEGGGRAPGLGCRRRGHCCSAKLLWTISRAHELLSLFASQADKFNELGKTDEGAFLPSYEKRGRTHFIQFSFTWSFWAA